jgi:hypothetical protein
VFSFSAVVIALLLIPTFICIIVFHFYFPRNTLKLSEVHLFPFGIGLTLILNLRCVFGFIELLSPPCCFTQERAEQAFVENLLHNSHALIVQYFFYFSTLPVFIFTILITAIYFVWRSQILNPTKARFSLKSLKEAAKERKILRYLLGSGKALIAEMVNHNVVNYMGRMTAYSPPKQQVLVDVLDANDSLYSGIFIEYFMEHKKLVGIQVSNVIRYSFKSETDRKDQTDAGAIKTDHSDQDGSKNFGRPYLVPNQGVMFFPVKNIQNLHFWYLSKDQHESIEIQRPDKQIRFAWLLGLSYSLPHLELKIKGLIPESAKQLDLTPLAKSFNSLGISPDVLFENVEFVKSETEPTPDISG